tara:strand:- start:312 stop:497 length:186 start_codon:yes stop_codon:yes gene_type:complete
MVELQVASESISPIWAVIYPFIPVAILLGVYYASGADQDDDDQGGGKGMMEPIYAPASNPA